MWKLDLESDSDSSISVIESQKQPTVRAPKQEASPCNTYSIDLSAVAERLDSDSDDSFLQPPSSHLVIQKASKSRKVQASLPKKIEPRKRPPNKENVPLKRNPPAQPKKFYSMQATPKNHSQKPNDEASECSSSSGESSALRRVARKRSLLAMTPPEDTGSPVSGVRHQSDQSNSSQTKYRLAKLAKNPSSMLKSDESDCEFLSTAPTKKRAPPTAANDDPSRDDITNIREGVEDAIQQDTDVEDQQQMKSKGPEQKEEFILPDFASSSSSSSSDEDDEDEEETNNTNVAPIPTVIGMPLSDKEGRSFFSAVPQGETSLQTGGIYTGSAQAARLVNHPPKVNSVAGVTNREFMAANDQRASHLQPRKSIYVADLEEAFFDGIPTVMECASASNQSKNTTNGAEANRELKSLKDLEEEAFFDGEGSGDNAVDLCEDQEGDAGRRVAPVHQGLRSPASTPDFNRRSQDFSISLRIIAPQADEIEYFSDDVQGFGTKSNRHSRGIDTTNADKPKIKASPIEFQTTHSSHAAQSLFYRRKSNNSIHASHSCLIPTIPVERQAKPRRIRDAWNSNPFFARSVTSTRQNSSAAGIIPTNNENVYYRQGQGQTNRNNGFVTWNQKGPYQSSDCHQSLRTDLAAGSRVGAGEYIVVNNSNDKRARGRHQRRATAARAGKRGKGRKPKGGWGGKREGRGGYRRGGRGGRGGRGSRAGGVMESAGADPILQHVGGADIKF